MAKLPTNGKRFAGPTREALPGLIWIQAACSGGSYRLTIFSKRGSPQRGANSFSS
jgi:hypothetical protein